MIPDQRARERALSPEHSFLVQAPAGSGKTSLLIERFLVLLSRVERPEHVLAMTFTRKAANEMRERILHALQGAGEAPPAERHKRGLHALAVQVMARDQALNWRLRENPGRLNIMTIDGFCHGLTRAMPLLSQFGCQADITDDPQSLYRQAAREALVQAARMAPYGQALYLLYFLVDGRQELLEETLAGMLSRRDQWQDWIVSASAQPRALRALMEGTLKAVIEEACSPLRAVFPPSLREEIAALAARGSANLQRKGKDCPWDALCEGAAASEPAWWQALAALLLTVDGIWRIKIDAGIGYPAKSPEQAALKALLDGLSDDAALAAQLHACRSLPPERLAEDSWEMLDAMARILKLCLAQLWVLFQEQRQLDHTAVALAAVQALGSAEAPSEQLLVLDARIQHLLVDEFQDTSLLQGKLLGLLTAGWQAGDGRTLFAVGDPMQSIYRFRKAELNLFLEAWERRRINHVPVEALSLSVNFRSEQGLVHWCNESFGDIFPPRNDLQTGAAAHHASQAMRPDTHAEHVTLHFWPARDPLGEAELVASEVAQALEESGAGGQVAVLVAQRGHAQAIMGALRARQIAYRAQEMDTLLSRPVVNDLLALSRALLHPADRLHLLALLRSPMLGLSLPDLACLVESDPAWRGAPSAAARPLETLLANTACLSADGQARMDRFLPLWQAALRRYGRMPVERLVRALWLNLGGPLCTDEHGLADAERFFEQLATLDAKRKLSVDALSRSLEKLYAAARSGPDVRVEILTMHKAKGLQFDTVILPQLSHRRGRDDQPLVVLEETLNGAVLMAPRPARGRQHADDRFYQWLTQREKQRLQEERKRLLYVAITRAERKLVLCGVAKTKEGDPVPEGELFTLLWDHVPPSRRFAHEPSSLRPESGFVPRRLRADWRMPRLDPPWPASRLEDGEQLAFWSEPD